MEKTAIIMDVVIPGDKTIIEKERKKLKSTRISKKRFRDFETLRKLM